MRTFLKKVPGYFKRINFTDAIYWRVQGHRSVTIRNNTTEFQTDSFGEAVVVDFSVSTERHIVADLLDEFRPDDTFYDVGANYGFYSCFAASLLPARQVYAFEPYPTNVSRLRANHELNDTSGVQIVEAALSDQTGRVPFDPPSWHHTVRGTSAIRSQSDYLVDAVTGDSFCRRGDVSPPTVLKIDVEGAELKVLEGIQETLTNPKCRTVYCEVHDRENGPSIHDYGATPADVRTFLKKCGFSLATLQSPGDETHLKGTKE